MKKPPLLLAAALALLLCAVGLVVYGETQVPAPRFTGSLHDLLPSAPPGWTRKEKAIADTPEMKEAVGELLNFDDGIFVDYTGASGERLSVYMAYWKPGKMSHRLIAVHTPDVCWVGSGWQKTKSTMTPALAIDGTDEPAPGKPVAAPVAVPPGEDRIFTNQGTPEYVWFWHLVGNEVKSYSTGAQPPWYAAISDIFERGLKQRDEQFFIRLSSSQPLENLMHGAILPDLLRRLPWPAADALKR